MVLLYTMFRCVYYWTISAISIQFNSIPRYISNTAIFSFLWFWGFRDKCLDTASVFLNFEARPEFNPFANTCWLVFLFTKFKLYFIYNRFLWIKHLIFENIMWNDKHELTEFLQMLFSLIDCLPHQSLPNLTFGNHLSIGFQSTNCLRWFKFLPLW